LNTGFRTAYLYFDQSGKFLSGRKIHSKEKNPMGGLENCMSPCRGLCIHRKRHGITCLTTE
jgi:hypothetical protein